MIEKINHYTLNTGNMRTTMPSEISTTVYFRLKSIINQAKETEYVDVIDNTKMHLTIENDDYACTLYSGSDNDSLVPILLTCGCKNRKDSYVWAATSDAYKRVYGEKIKIVPMAPFIADIVLPGAFTRMDALTWTGDFSRCLGWLLLEPRAVLN